MRNEITKGIIDLLERKKREYENLGFFATIDLLINDLKSETEHDHDCHLSPMDGCDDPSHARKGEPITNPD